MRYGRWIIPVLALLLAGSSFFAAAKKKKNPDDITQTLELPKDPPQVAIGETRRLMFQVSPLSAKGLLSQQTRDALKAIMKENGGVPVVHIRAFVAGSGDVRRVPQIVSEVFTEKKQPIPSVSVVLSGGLPLENAQVVLEAVSVARRDVNPGGLDFVAGDPATASDPATATRPLLDRALDQLSRQLNGAPALAVSCFVSTLGNPAELTSGMQARFPGVVTNLVQTQRGPYRALAVCEAVSRGNRIKADRLAFSGTRVAFGAQEKDATLAFQRLDRDLTEAGAAPSSIVFTHLYPLSAPIAEMARSMRKSTAPMGVVPFEGLASVDAGFAVDAIAAVQK